MVRQCAPRKPRPLKDHDSGSTSNPTTSNSLQPDWVAKFADRHGLLVSVPSTGPTAVSEDDNKAEQRRSLKAALTSTGVMQRADRTDCANEGCTDVWTKIGEGECGFIFTLFDNSAVVKLERQPDMPLENGYKQHIKIEDAFIRFSSSQVRIPELHGFYYPGRGFSEAPGIDIFEEDESLRRVAGDYCANVPTPAIVTSHILPVRKVIRDALVRLYAPNALKKSAVEEIENGDCLIRLYLGKSDSVMTPRRPFSLRNFNMNLNHIQELDLNIEELANKMGQALAVMHWSANVDGRDVEFVLGSSRTSRPINEPDFFGTNLWFRDLHLSPDTAHLHYRYLRTDMFLLDFNLVRNITMNDYGIEIAVEAFKGNDPYYPRPNQTSQIGVLAWNAFVKGYLTSATAILGIEERVERLAARFLERIMMVYPPPRKEEV